MNINKDYSGAADHYKSRLGRKLVPRFTIYIALFVLSALVFFPALVQSQECHETGDIPFEATNKVLVDMNSPNLCLQCVGPWGRSSKLCYVKEGVVNNEFYAAKRTIFSPFGKWVCKVWLNENEPADSCFVEAQQAPLDTIDFCLKNNPFGSKVYIDLVTDDSGNVKLKVYGNVGNTPCSSSSVTSFLGDNNKQQRLKRDTDLFYFSGTGGDEVFVTLQPYPAAGDNSGDAVLKLRGNSLDESVSGTPPLEITSVLPADGEYSIIVKQANTPPSERFRGSYILKVIAQSGSIELIEPAANVEK